MIKIGILEDDKRQQEELKRFLERFQRDNQDFLYTTESFDTGERLLFYPRRDFDLLFLDIQLPDMLGIDVAREIRKRDEDVMIVFITNLSQYAIDGYTVSAYDYILKPLLYAPFEIKMRRFLKVLSHKHGRILTIKTKQEIIRFDIGELFYVESEGHHLTFHTRDRDIDVWGTLKEYEEELADAYFYRCNACYLVNLRHVDVVKGSVVIVHGTELAISQAKRKSFVAQLAKYKGGDL